MFRDAWSSWLTYACLSFGDSFTLIFSGFDIFSHLYCWRLFLLELMPTRGYRYMPTASQATSVTLSPPMVYCASLCLPKYANHDCFYDTHFSNIDFLAIVTASVHTDVLAGSLTHLCSGLSYCEPMRSEAGGPGSDIVCCVSTNWPKLEIFRIEIELL